MSTLTTERLYQLLPAVYRLRDVEQGLITWALKVSGGNKSKAAELLQIKRSTLGDRIKKLGLPDAGDDGPRSSTIG